MKRIAKRITVMAMVCVLLGTMATPVLAAASKTVKKSTFTTSTSTIEKKATKVKKGTTNLTFSKGEGYIKFVAPKTKTYKFTFSKCTSKQFSSNAFIAVQTPSKTSSKYSFYTDVKTKGGKYDTLWLSMNGYKHTDGKILYRPLASRTATIKLKKGQKIYFHLYTGTSKKASMKLVIK